MLVQNTRLPQELRLPQLSEHCSALLRCISGDRMGIIGSVQLFCEGIYVGRNRVSAFLKIVNSYYVSILILDTIKIVFKHRILHFNHSFPTNRQFDFLPVLPYRHSILVLFIDSTFIYKHLFIDFNTEVADKLSMYGSIGRGKGQKSAASTAV